jgi:large subunit ribosomal protein L24
MKSTKPLRNPGKQRKMLFNAPAHIRHKLMAAPLSPELFAQKGIKTLPVRKGDTVRIMRGDHKGFEGKVSRVDLKHYRVYLEGLTREKVDGTAVFVASHPSKVMIKTLNLDDKLRKAVLERKKPIFKKAKKVVKKAPAPKKVTEEEKPAEVKEEEPAEEAKPAVAVPEEAVAEKEPLTAVSEKLAEKQQAKAAPAQKKPAAKKKKEEAAPAKEKPAAKAEEPKAAAKKPAAKRKTPSKAEGGT